MTEQHIKETYDLFSDGNDTLFFVGIYNGLFIAEVLMTKLIDEDQRENGHRNNLNDFCFKLSDAISQCRKEANKDLDAISERMAASCDEAIREWDEFYSRLKQEDNNGNITNNDIPF